MDTIVLKTIFIWYIVRKLINHVPKNIPYLGDIGLKIVKIFKAVGITLVWVTIVKHLVNNKKYKGEDKSSI